MYVVTEKNFINVYTLYEWRSTKLLVWGVCFEIRENTVFIYLFIYLFKK